MTKVPSLSELVFLDCIRLRHDALAALEVYKIKKYRGNYRRYAAVAIVLTEADPKCFETNGGQEITKQGVHKSPPSLTEAQFIHRSIRG